MQWRSRETRGFAGVLLAIVAAGLHLVWAAPRLIAYLGLGRLPDARPLLFVLSAAVVAAAAVAYHAGAPRRRVYGVLVLVMVAYLSGYAGWHLAGHPIVGSDGTIRTIHHPDGPLVQLVDHLGSDPFAATSVVLSVVVLALLAPLLADTEA